MRLHSIRFQRGRAPQFTGAKSIPSLTQLALAILLIGFGCNFAIGQQTIINVPSDVLTPEGKHFFLHESVLTPGAAPDAEYSTTNFYCFGLDKTTELTLTMYNVDSDDSELICINPGFKTVLEVFHNFLPDLEPKLTFGLATPISLKQALPQVGWFPYAHVAANIPGTELRILGGAAGVSKNFAGQDTLSVLGGLEFPITEHLSFTGEWFSGNHDLSALIPGVTYHHGDLLLVAGYKIPNNFDLTKSGIVLEIGVFFGGAGKKIDHYGIFDS